MTTSWPNDYQGQQDYINDMLAILEELENEAYPVTISSDTKPTQAEMLTQWVEEKGFSPPLGAKIQWYAPAAGELNKTLHVTNDVDASSSSGDFLDSVPTPENNSWTILDEISVWTDGVSSDWVVTIPPDYVNVVVSGTLRFTGAADDYELQVLLDGAGSYEYINDLTLNGVRSSVLAAAQSKISIDRIPGNTSDGERFAYLNLQINDYQGGDGLWYTTVTGSVSSVYGQLASADNVDNIFFAVWENTGVPTSFTIRQTHASSPSVKFAPGTHMIAYGVYPTE